MRVEIPAYTDSWMRGDRYGEVVHIYKGGHVYRVELDKSGKSIRVQAEDCKEV